jgi:hypothetical protein
MLIASSSPGPTMYVESATGISRAVAGVCSDGSCFSRLSCLSFRRSCARKDTEAQHTSAVHTRNAYTWNLYRNLSERGCFICSSEDLQKDSVTRTEGGTRTRTDLSNPKDFKSFASTNSATPAQDGGYVLEATIGFEPMHGAFAERSLSHLGTSPNADTNIASG